MNPGIGRGPTTPPDTPVAALRLASNLAELLESTGHRVRSVTVTHDVSSEPHLRIAVALEEMSDGSAWLLGLTRCHVKADGTGPGEMVNEGVWAGVHLTLAGPLRRTR